MTKAEHIKRYGIRHYRKNLKQSRDGSKANRKAILEKQRNYMASLSDEEKETLKKAHNERARIIREKDRDAFNAYHNKYYHQNKIKIRKRINAQRRANHE